MPQGGLSASLDVTFLVGLGHQASRAPVRAAKVAARPGGP
jgi:hypothetical protein